MAYGLQTYFADGSPQLTITDRVTRFIQENSVYLGQRSGANIYVSGMANDGTWGVMTFAPCRVAIYNGYYNIYNYEYYATWGTALVFRY